MTDSYVHAFSAMGTVVSLQVVGHDDRERERAAAVARAAGWFHDIESTCSRFDPSSELSQLCATPERAVRVSAMLFEAVGFAVAVAEESDGAFDPTIGGAMEALGFDREHRSGQRARLGHGADDASWRDIFLDEKDRAITLRKPIVLDLGAVVKGLAIDMAARELAPFENFAIDAGGDLYLGGINGQSGAWTVGVRHPREPDLIETLTVSDKAVCTSGDYERTIQSPLGEAPTHHIVDPRGGVSSRGAASVTVVAPSAMVADALATAAFVLGPEKGIEFLERQGVDGMIVTPALERFATRGMRAEYSRARK